jgi:hypothetical protein
LSIGKLNDDTIQLNQIGGVQSFFKRRWVQLAWLKKYAVFSAFAFDGQHRTHHPAASRRFSKIANWGMKRDIRAATKINHARRNCP